MTQRVVITGASAGVGRAVARAYAARGARLALLARGAAGLAAAERDCRRLGAAEVRTYQVDVADAGAVQRAADDVAHHYGGLDVWINDAMVSVFAPAWEVTAAEFRRVTEVNYLGTVHGTLAALRHMRARGRGAIVQVGSALAYRGIPLQSAYCASKHAVQGFNDSLRAELLHNCPGVKLSMVQLPAVNTPQFSWVRTRLPRHPQPVPPIFAPEVAARAVVWAADRGPRELNVGGPTWRARLGNVLFPGLLDRKLARDGYDSQQTDAPIDRATWRDNLDRPGDDERDRGAEGVFTDRARRHSAALWVSTHKPAVSALTLGGLLVAAGGLARRSR
ncbi:SDR family oxidoreductase [Micromonospora fulviviridis]|uniref:SDR family oxidoreductase n=1 Tax=Micromonospora fulviviridis TaxID=47860 RepID=A0ABV2VJP9_9ACTN